MQKNSMRSACIWSRRFLMGMALFSGFCLLNTAAAEEIYTLPSNGDTVVGSTRVASLKMGDTLSSFAQRNGTGYYEVLDANPRLDPLRVSSNTRLLLPTQYILPDAPKQGIVINLAELRLYYYPPNSNTVAIYPIGIGRIGWQTPTGTLSIIQKKKDPDWRVPAVVAEDMAKRGVILPEVVPAGPDNPLGAYMMRMSNYSYLIHGTNNPQGVGRRTSAGCVRMYPEDIERLFAIVPLNTQVTIVNQPFKAGWLKGQLYFEAHTPLREQRAQYAGVYDALWNSAIQDAMLGRSANVFLNQVRVLAKQQTGVPQVIGQLSASTTAENTINPTTADPGVSAAPAQDG